MEITIYIYILLFFFLPKRVGSHLELFKSSAASGRTDRVGALCLTHSGEVQTIKSVVEIPPGKGKARGRSAPLLAVSVEQGAGADLCTDVCATCAALPLRAAPRSQTIQGVHPVTVASSSFYISFKTAFFLPPPQPGPGTSF